MTVVFLLKDKRLKFVVGKYNREGAQFAKLRRPVGAS